MNRASYNRSESGGGIVYDITPIPRSKAKAFGSGMIMLALQTIAVYVVAWVPSVVIAILLFNHKPTAEAVVIALLPILFAVAFVFWMRKYKAKTMGTRQSVQVSINDDEVRITRESDGVVTVPVGQIRRLVIGNTYDQNRAQDSGTYIAPASTGRAIGSAIRANVENKLPQFCFSLLLQYGNENQLIVDGLDELTASNLLDDMGADMQMGDMPSSAAVSPA